MEDTVIERDDKDNEIIDKIKEMANSLRELKGEDTLILDISKDCGWTDYAIITTGTSGAHLSGLYREMIELVHENGLTARNERKKNIDENWILLDCGNLIINLMNKKTREYYDLENRWFNSDKIDF